MFWNDHDQVTGFWGLAPGRDAAAPRRARRGRAVAWCAFDPLCPARVIGDLQVTTADPVTGQAITYRIGRDGAITGASHPGSVLSFLRPDKPWGDDVQTTFCRYVHHFTGPATAQQWTAGHPGTFVTGLGDAAELACRHTARTAGPTAAGRS